MRTEQTYVQLDARLSSSVEPTPVLDPQWIAFNDELAVQLQLPLTQRATPEGLQIFAGNSTPDWAQPHALAYAGHQFANYVPQLGDGRAVLLTEVVDKNGQRYDIQLKGSGRTPYSRGGDGRSPLGPVLREYLVSEAMHHLNVPTTRALAAVASGEMVKRESIEPGAILTRVAKSHLRVGTAQYVLALQERKLLKAFADYVIQRHYPACASAAQPYLALLTQVRDNQAALIAQWMSLGFIHGVMNTDNMTLSGETIDYGPCAFMEAYDPQQVFSSIDRRGRYMYQNQPPIGMWNIARFAETLLPLLELDEQQAIAQASEVVHGFEHVYQQQYHARMSAKLGLAPEHPQAEQLLEDFLQLMHHHQVDFTLGFRYLSDNNDKRIGALFQQSPTWQKWYQQWQNAHEDINAAKQQMAQVNPIYIPRNHLVHEVIMAATNDGDLMPFNTLHRVLKNPFTEDTELARYAQPAARDEQVTRTFCGT